MICASACADQDASINTRLMQTASGRSSEYVTELSEGWKFGGREQDASAEDYNDQLWPTVNIPHTWNITDAPAEIVRSFTVPAGSSLTFDEDAFIADPHLWKGIDYSGKTGNSDIGYRYTVTLSISDGDRIIDSVSDMVGFRYFYVDKEKGFFLNGEAHPLRGVNHHQFADGLGNTLKELNHVEDMELIKELGANTIRLCHYPHTDYFYDLCDENGIIVWTEIPLVNAVGKLESFMDVTKTQLTELIRQQYNRPSICFWGLENEISDNTRSEFYTAKVLLSELDSLAHREDASGRYTTQAVNRNISMDENDPAKLADDTADIGWKSDLIAWNVYPGWYSSFVGTFQEVVDNKTSRDSRPMGLSEYGWGASVTQHELYPELGKNNLLPTGKWHPEEYQSLMHEQAVAYIAEHDNLWCTFIWAMFDFDVDSRNEGSRAAQNDKGLVTNDRTVKKDSFYLYKANWDKRAPFAHITSSRFVSRGSSSTYVKVYSNCDSVDLYLNGKLIGSMESLGNGIFLWENLDLVIGDNKVLAIGKMGGQTCEDTCVWARSASVTTNLVSDILQVDTSAATVFLSHPMTLGRLREILKTADHATYRVTIDGEEITNEATPVDSRMKIIVTSESNSKTKEYKFAADAMRGKKAWATSSEKGNNPENVLSADRSTRWTAVNNSYPQSITVDLGKLSSLQKIKADWYDKGDRYYTYTIEFSEDGENYTLAVDRRNNMQTHQTVDMLYMAKARYVRINILSCSKSSGYAGLYSIYVETCLSLSSEAYTVDQDNMLILVPDTEGLTVEKLSSQLTAGDDSAFFIQAETDEIAEGTQVILVNVSGETNVYRVTTEKNAHLYLSDVARYKRVYCSSEEGTSSSGLSTQASNINDGLMNTAWVADTKVKGVPGKKANYPEWVCIDLGQDYDLSSIELSFETKKDRVYQYQIFVSTETPWFENTISLTNCAKIVDLSNNKTFDNGQYRFELQVQKARYIVVVVLGNNLYPENKFAAAGIYDLKAYGTSYSAEDRYEKTGIEPQETGSQQ